MPQPRPESPSAPPSWPHCGKDPGPERPFGCPGIHIPGHTACLAHLPQSDRDAFLAGLAPGADIDHRGTPFTTELLGQLLTALRDPATGSPHVGAAQFDWVAFSGDARFDRVTFSDSAGFNWAAFSGDARFDGAAFSGDARFMRSTFANSANFERASFSGDALFERAGFSGAAVFVRSTFAKSAQFDLAAFSDVAWFDEAVFSGDALFGGAAFSDDARFSGAQFKAASHLGPLVCGKSVMLNGALFQQPVTVNIAARKVSCARTRWAETATLHLRYTDLELIDAVLNYPVTVVARPDPWFHQQGGVDRRDAPLSEVELSGQEPCVRLTSVGGVDTAHLALQDIDLSICRFAGAVHLDQMKVDGWCTFATTPTGWSRLFPWRWSRRITLAEEHHWRVRTARHPNLAVTRGWTTPPQNAPELKPTAVAALYRQLRKSLEDGKNEPDAADFYYGECGAA
ncbi:pentapeptide repeat-containing protein [Streptomyces europaeiscabiei]|uniref:pentapeptide repeat-containing protein n=1 Tax=Streptomyces europaeiscabiei TaxID=146819 RepID=UPI0038F6A9EF